MSRILGIDPGSAATGWAVVESQGSRHLLVASGVIRPPGGERAERLAFILTRLREVLDAGPVDGAAVETPFSGRNLRSGLALAETRGVILAALGEAGVSVCGYSPAQVKSTIVGTGKAEKAQVGYMVVRLLGLQRSPPTDAADAMAVALTHLRHL